MRKIWMIAQTYVKLAFTTPITLVMAFIMPIIFTAVLGVAFSSGSNTDTRVPILAVNEDGGVMADAILNRLNDSSAVRLISGDALPTTRTDARSAIKNYHRVLILPAGLSESALSGTPVTTDFLVDTNNLRTSAARQEILAILSDVNGAISVAQTATDQAEAIRPFASTTEKNAFFQKALALAETELADPTITIRAEKATKLASLDGNSQSSPGNLVTFGLITLLATAVALVEERNQGTLKRLVASPISKSTLLIGKTLGPLLVGIIQMTVLIVVGQLFFHVQWGRSPLALVMMVLAFDIAAVSIGIFLSTVVKTSSQAVGIMIAASMTMGALGGAWWPLDIVPTFMQRLGHFFPSAWAMDGFQAIILRGASPAAVVLPTVILLGFAVVFFSLGIWRFKYE